MCVVQQTGSHQVVRAEMSLNVGSQYHAHYTEAHWTDHHFDQIRENKGGNEAKGNPRSFSSLLSLLPQAHIVRRSKKNS
jgi:hypothetical protein